jgi:hypothetical protein
MKTIARGVAFSLLAGTALLALWLVIERLVEPDQSRPALGVEEKSRLEGAVRAGSPEFEQYRGRIAMGQSQAIVAHRALGDLVMELTTVVRNDTGRVINGLEMRGIVFDAQGFPSLERTAVIIPTQQTALEPNEVIKARILLEDVEPEVKRAKVRMEVTGVLFD